jgi:hypothetical protein
MESRCWLIDYMAYLIPGTGSESHFDQDDAFIDQISEKELKFYSKKGNLMLPTSPTTTIPVCLICSQ